jgi:hypothetical protein
VAIRKLIKKLYIYILFWRITQRTVDSINGLPCEIAYYDRNGEIIGYWAYGYFDPKGKYRG